MTGFQPLVSYMMNRWICAKLLLLFSLTIALVSGCSVATNVRRNTEAIEGSSASIRSNTAAVQESTKGTSALVPALEGAERLRQPLTDVARLEPTLKAVAGLG